MTNPKVVSTKAASPIPGSFRDPCNRVYQIGNERIVRGIDEATTEHMTKLLETSFFQKFMSEGKVVDTALIKDTDSILEEIPDHNWHAALEHNKIPFISYPYEWTFTMLRDAALLHLELLEAALENGWTLKDSTPYNVQWVGSQPVFIDIPSFEPWEDGESWLGHRQFTMLFLTPLLMRVHLGIDHMNLMKANLDGIPPTEAAKYFHGTKKFKKGVMSNIIFPAKVENRILGRERDDTKAEKREARKQSKIMVLGLVQSMRRLVASLKIDIEHTDWSQYDKTHTYDEEDFDTKCAFVKSTVDKKEHSYVWDIGCNTGTFSEIASTTAGTVIALDGDHNAVEQLYLRLRDTKDNNILPLVMNLSNISPNHGWAGNERSAFDSREKPSLIIALALIHHIRIAANIPNKMFLAWLASTGADVVLEFVDRHDEMVIKLLTNKKEQYSDYNLEQFYEDVAEHFDIVSQMPVKGGKRQILHLTHKN